MTTSTTGVLAPLIEERQRQLGVLCRRLTFLRAFEAHLVERSRGKQFRIANEALWSVMLGDRDHLVVSAASWARAAYKPGGLFGTMKAHLHELAFKRVTYPDKYEERLVNEHKRSTYEQLFPATGGKPRRSKLVPEDIDQLCARFDGVMGPVIADRDEVRAHPFEADDESAEAKMLRLDQVVDALHFAQELLNDLRIIVCNQTFHDHEAKAEPTDRRARDVVDLVFFSTIDYFVDRYAKTESLGARSRMLMSGEKRSTTLCTQSTTWTLRPARRDYSTMRGSRVRHERRPTGPEAHGQR